MMGDEGEADGDAMRCDAPGRVLKRKKKEE